MDKKTLKVLNNMMIDLGFSQDYINLCLGKLKTESQLYRMILYIMENLPQEEKMVDMFMEILLLSD